MMPAGATAMPEICGFDGDRPAHAPRVLALDTRAPRATPHAQERDHARAMARTALRQALATHLGCAPQALHVSDERGTPPRLGWAAGGATPLDSIGLSISHAPGLTLAAWCPHGAVGVDVQAVPHAAVRADLWQTATLFLAPNQLEMLDGQASDASFLEAFTRCWAAHEAALKCAGLALAEYSPALAARLHGVQAAPLTLPGWAAKGRVAALAWRAVKTPR